MAERIGILGAGQHARMLLQAAIPLGLETTILASSADDPAVLVARHSVIGDLRDPTVLNQFVDGVDVVVLENAFIGADALELLAERRLRLMPSAATLALIEDKVVQKETLAAAGLPVAPLAPIETPADLERLAAEWGWPIMLKTRRNSYAGRGTAPVNGPADCARACELLGWPGNPLYAEAWVPCIAELATIVVRSATGASCVYPVVETLQPAGVCRIVRAPAPFDSAVQAEARRIGQAAAEALGSLGILAVEMFLTADHHVLINEVEPCPHNAGHYSIEGCHCSQFENTLRAALGWPLGDPGLRAPAAAMVNILGPCTRSIDAALITPALAVPGAYIHWYARRAAEPGHKIGHVTAVGPDLATVEAIAQRAVTSLEMALSQGGAQ